MSQLPTLSLVIDKTGSLAANLITLEAHTSPVRNTRVIKPNFSPFFTADLKLYSSSTLGVNTLLTRGVHYTCVELFERVTQELGKEVCGAILISNNSLPVDFKITYQALGGLENVDITAVAVAVRDLVVSGNPVDWANVLDKPLAYTPGPHLHDVLDIYGLEYINDALKTLSSIISADGDGDHKLILNEAIISRATTLTALNGLISLIESHATNKANAHNVTKGQIGLGSVQNRGFTNKTVLGVEVEPYTSPKSLINQLRDSVLYNILEHTLNFENPHELTALQVGLDLVQDYATATNAETIQGISDALYTTPAGVKASINNTYGTKLNVSQKGADSGVAPLDEDEQIPSAHLLNYAYSPNYDNHTFLNGKPAINEILLQAIAPRAFSCPLNFSGSLAHCIVPATTDFVIEILKSGVVVGTVTYATGDTFGTFESASATTFNIGDQMTVRCTGGVQDATLSDVSICIFGTTIIDGTVVVPTIFVGNTPSSVVSFALFGGGYTDEAVATMDKYVYASNTVTPGISLNVERHGLAATGNGTIGLFGGGSIADAPFYSNYTDKYAYASDTVVPGTVLGLARYALAAAGNATRGIFTGGDNGSKIGYSDNYTYSSNVVAAGGDLGVSRSGLTGTGNSTVGLFAGGFNDIPQSSIDRYTYADDTVSNGAVLGVARAGSAAVGTSTYGIFGGGYAGEASSYTDKCFYSDDTLVPGTALGLARSGLAAAGDDVFGLFSGGSVGSPSSYTDKYTYSSSVVSPSTVLSLARSVLAATSSSPGGF